MFATEAIALLSTNQLLGSQSELHATRQVTCRWRAVAGLFPALCRFLPGFGRRSGRALGAGGTRLFRLRPALVLRIGNSLLGFGAHGPSLCTRLLRHDRRNDLRGSAGLWLLCGARQ